MPQDWIVSKVFLRVEGAQSKAGSWALQGPGRVRDLHQGRKDSNKVGCMGPGEAGSCMPHLGISAKSQPRAGAEEAEHSAS